MLNRQASSSRVLPLVKTMTRRFFAYSATLSDKFTRARWQVHIQDIQTCYSDVKLMAYIESRWPVLCIHLDAQCTKNAITKLLSVYHARSTHLT